ncbi:MAG TPA: inositol monophosphatase family protein, partial [Myxococcota bacterium]|nr:inositol monophosphatase family protein [Myxococcota bacterium]
AGIRRSHPDHAILAEESGAHASAGPYRWVIDPLDGTVNFAHGVPHWCVLIAVQERLADGAYATVCGVTWDPLRREEFVAVRGGGARLNDAPVRVSKAGRLIDSTSATGFGYDRLLRPDDNHAEFCRMNLLSQGVRRFGSAGLDLAYVACGRFDFYWEYRLNPWDLSPGVLLVEEAGGRVTDLQGAPGAAPEGTLLGSNGLLHDACLAALASARTAPINSRVGLVPHLPPELAARLPRD